MDLSVVAAIAAIVVLGVIGTVVYIIRTSSKSSQFGVTLYSNWTERFDLEPLSTEKKSADANTKLLNRNIKLLWNKKKIEEIDLKPEIEGLTQQDALEFLADADSIFMEGSESGFVYDIQDAREGNLRLIAMEKSSASYRGFVIGQAILKLLKEQADLVEFPDIELPDGALDVGLGELESFVVANSRLDLDPEELYKATAVLGEKFGDEWNVFLVADDVLKFQREVTQEYVEPEPEKTDNSPFALQREAKRLAEEEAAQLALEAEEQRRLRWQAAEATKREAEIAERDAAIQAGEVSALAAKPLDFLSQAIEIAADTANIQYFDDEVEIRKTDRIGAPTFFTVYSDEVIDREDEGFIIFVEALLKAVSENFGGEWSYSLVEDNATSLSFERAIL